MSGKNAKKLRPVAARVVATTPDTTTDGSVDAAKDQPAADVSVGGDDDLAWARKTMAAATMPPRPVLHALESDNVNDALDDPDEAFTFAPADAQRETRSIAWCTNPSTEAPAAAAAISDSSLKDGECATEGVHKSIPVVVGGAKAKSKKTGRQTGKKATVAQKLAQADVVLPETDGRSCGKRPDEKQPSILKPSSPVIALISKRTSVIPVPLPSSEAVRTLISMPSSAVIQAPSSAPISVPSVMPARSTAVIPAPSSVLISTPSSTLGSRRSISAVDPPMQAATYHGSSYCITPARVEMSVGKDYESRVLPGHKVTTLCCGISNAEPFDTDIGGMF